MFNRNKKTIVFALILLISFSSVSYLIPKTESIDPFFTLVARGFNSRHMDYLNLMKQQLARIGINLDVHFFNWSEVKILSNLLILRDMDLMIVDIFDIWELDPFLSDFFTENGSMNFIGYKTEVDWDDKLGTGKNEWYIENGLEMISNDSQEQINHCWEWQHYMMNELLPCLPLFTPKNNHSSYELLFYNIYDRRPVIGGNEPSPTFPEYSQGLSVRKALSYAINREEIRRVVLGDDYEVIHHPTNPSLDEWLNPNVIQYCYNLNAARSFLTSAGYSILWCGNPPVYEVPPWTNWEYYCTENTSLNISGYRYLVTIISFISFFTVIMKVKLNKRRKNI